MKLNNILLGFIFLVFAIAINSCCKEEYIYIDPPMCQYNDPLTELDWLKTKVDSYPNLIATYLLYDDSSQYFRISGIQNYYSETFNCEGVKICNSAAPTGVYCQEYFDARTLISSKLLKY